MKLTHHSRLRLSERANICKQNHRQFFRLALDKGKSAAELKDGLLKDYLLKLENNKCKAKIYNGFVFIYGRNNKKLFTIYNVPEELKK